MNLQGAPSLRNGPVSQSAFDRKAGNWVLVAAILGSSMAFIDGTVVNVALPALQTQFRASGAEVQWVVESYALFLAALLLVGGTLGDRYGRKPVFSLGVVIFAVGSAFCGVSASLTMLIWARATQGLGAALLVPGSLALITATFPTALRGKAIGTWSGFTAITAAVGPLMGGWFIQHESWRWVFFLNIPIAIITLGICYRFVTTQREQHPSVRMDWWGATLGTCGLGGVTFGLIEYVNGAGRALLAGWVGVLCLVLFVLVERSASEPMVPLTLFKSRDFAGANAMTLFLYAALGGVLYYLPLNLMQVQHYTPTAAGASMLPLILLLFLLSRWSGGLIARYGARTPLIAGPLIAAVGFTLLSFPAIGGNYWTTFFPAIFVLGIGLAVSVAPLTTLVMSAVPEELAGSASGVNNAVSRVASLLAIALFGLILTPLFNTALKTGLLQSDLTQEVQQSTYAQRGSLAAIQTPDQAVRKVVEASFVHGFRRIVLMAAGLSLLAMLSAILLIRTGRAGGGDQRQVILGRPEFTVVEDRL